MNKGGRKSAFNLFNPMKLTLEVYDELKQKVNGCNMYVRLVNALRG